MRFIFAIVSFVIAALLIATGVAQKTIFLPPDEVTASVSVDSAATVSIIDGATMQTFPHQQTLSVGGSSEVFTAYGRTADVMAWVGDASYNLITYSAKTKNLSSKLVTKSDTEVPDPTGSDLWFAEYTDTVSLKQRLTVDDTVSLIIVSNGTDPAPPNIALAWPVNNATPWATPLLIGGGIVLLLGLGLLLWAIAHLRNSRGPRRRSPKMPKLPKQPRYKPSKARKALPASTRGRRSTRTTMIAAPLAIASIIALSGCTADPTVAPNADTVEATPTPDAAAEKSAAPPTAVTERQANRIVQRIAQVAGEADKTLDADLLQTRFAGDALALRSAAYKVKKVDDAEPLPSVILDHTVEIVLPQQNAGWPRTVFVVVRDEADETIAPIAMMLIQNDPRSQYLVHYAVDLEPGTVVPEVAPADIGTSRIGPDQLSNFYVADPSEIATDYGDILNKGEKSEFFALFDATGDTLRDVVGVEAKKKLKKDLPDTAKLTFSNATGAGEVIVMATLDTGAIVAVSLDEIQTIKPIETGATANAPKGMKALAGKSVSDTGFTATYGDQLLFYVPSAAEGGLIKLLGYSTGLVSASELKK